MRFQFALACNMNSRDHTELVHKQSGPSAEVVICSGFPAETADAICRSLNLCHHDSVYCLKWFSLGHCTFKPNSIVVLSSYKGVPQFGIVMQIISVDVTTYVVVGSFTNKSL
jgi:hypothetical protein